MERMEKIINTLQSREHCCVTTSDHDAQTAATGSARREDR